MPLVDLTIKDFRCLGDASLTADPHYTLIYGANASGKTSILEAIAYLGRGKSFRGAPTQVLIRRGEKELLLVGTAESNGRTQKLGVRNSSAGLEVSIDGDRSVGAAGLAEALPLQIIGPDVHDLVAGGPEERRSYLDWIAFHVEPGYLDNWRRFRRALKQRNAALRSGASAMDGWNKELAETAALVHEVRQGIADIVAVTMEEVSEALLGSGIQVEYRQGWAADQGLLQALEAALEKEREQGNTAVGPHRADLKLSFEERAAKKMVSRGQQKLLACALIISAVDIVQTHLERPMLLLLDDPAAELDTESLIRLMTAIIGLGCQVVATALEADTELFPASPAVFHVEQGVLSPVR